MHNGIIENYLVLKEDLIAKGHKFVSETDTEVVAHLMAAYYDGDFEETVKRVLRVIEDPIRWCLCVPKNRRK